MNNNIEIIKKNYFINLNHCNSLNDFIKFLLNT